MLGMGLRAITAKQEDDDTAEAVEAEQDGLGGVVSMLTGAAVILARGGFCLARRRGRAFCSERSEIEPLSHHFFSHGLTIRGGET